MKRLLTWAAVVTMGIGGTHTTRAQEEIAGLPTPHYHPEATDPAWLAFAAQFHGHIGPWATSGLRAGMIARRAVGAKGYFDLRVEVEGPLVKPPHSCFLDGLQVSTGATLGKRNLIWTETDALVVRVTNTKTGKQVELRPTAKLLAVIASMKPTPVDSDDHGHAHDHGEGSADAVARRIVAMPEKELFAVKVIEKE
ncbi:MAG: formylmethanofuran dehydrogenase subunit E family protein [Pirellulales bacterium]|nr:formylmethanofuran dehydrogenase subunit E family protein [Pirellulales bacterium]